jgi:hypothetical protein
MQIEGAPLLVLQRVPVLKVFVVGSLLLVSTWGYSACCYKRILVDLSDFCLGVIMTVMQRKWLNEASGI